MLRGLLDFIEACFTLCRCILGAALLALCIFGVKDTPENVQFAKYLFIAGLVCFSPEIYVLGLSLSYYTNKKK